jgi:hypothetical protein
MFVAAMCRCICCSGLQNPAAALRPACLQVREGDGSSRADALVNAGNTLCSWAQQLQQLCPPQPQQALQLVDQAVQAYQAAISKEEDALVGGWAGWCLAACTGSQHAPSCLEC